MKEIDKMYDEAYREAMGTEMKHTPGPWHIGQGNGEGSIFAEMGRMRLEPGGTTLYPICKVLNFDGEGEANAKRIVSCVNACEGMNPEAVPDLLEACEVVLASITDVLKRDKIPIYEFEALVDQGRQLKQAIAKATT